MNEIIEVYSQKELYSLFPKNGVGAELGVCQGYNAVSLYTNTNPSHLYLIDLWVRDEISYKYHKNPKLHYDDWTVMVRNKLPYDNVTLVKQDTIQWLDSIPDNFLDWIYIDSSHNYDHVSVEYSKAIKKVKKGGIISGHDFYCHPQAWKTGVIRAVLNQVQNNNLLLTHITSEHEMVSIMGVNVKS